jgi:starvation-inducible outer membrane lipoprotein
MQKLFVLVLAFILSGCVVPKQEIKVQMCTVQNACHIDSHTTVEPMQLPKVLP